MDACKPEDKANGLPIVPCGLIAWSLFNDTYSFSRNTSEPLLVNKKDIAWKSDKEHKFGKDVFPKNFQNSTLKGGASLNASIPVSYLPLLFSSVDFVFPRFLLCIFECSETPVKCFLHSSNKEKSGGITWNDGYVYISIIHTSLF